MSCKMSLNARSKIEDNVGVQPGGRLAPFSVIRMDSAHVADVVAVHIKAFPGFFLSVLGGRFLTVLYEEILADPSGIAFVCLDGNCVVGFVAGTDTLSGFYRRLLHRRWWRFGMASVFPIAKRPVLIPRLLNAFRRPNDASDSLDESELMSIAVDPAARGRRAGAHLVAAFIGAAAKRGQKRVILTTDRAGNDAVNRFYEALGFHVARIVTTAQGRTLNQYVIAVDGLQ
jgi:ribosomal protein S18 acetylase RimI-like enzyme